MGFDLAGMGNVAQGASDMRDAQDRQLYNRNVRQQQLQTAEDNALRLRTLQQAEVNRQVQAKQNADFVDSNAALRQPKRYTETAINPDAANMPVAPAAPLAPAVPDMPNIAYTPAPTTASLPVAGISTPASNVSTPVPATPAAAKIAADRASMTHTPLPSADPNISAWQRLKAMAGNKYTPENKLTMALPRVGDTNAPASFAQLNAQRMPQRPFTPTPVANASTATTATTVLPAACLTCGAHC